MVNNVCFGCKKVLGREIRVTCMYCHRNYSSCIDCYAKIDKRDKYNEPCEHGVAMFHCHGYVRDTKAFNICD